MTENDETRKIRVLVVDDSPLMSRQIAGILAEDEEIQVAGNAENGQDALTLVEQIRPDVITLDVEMPIMNGITALKHIMVKYAIPTVMISALTQEGARTTFDALKFGAVDVVGKPSRREDASLEKQKADIITKVKRAASIRAGISRYLRVSPVDVPVKRQSGVPPDSATRFIGIGAGIGGYNSLLRIIPGLPADFNHVLMATVLAEPRVVDLFVSYLEAHSSVPVKNAREVETIEAGVCYVSSGEDGFVLTGNGNGGGQFRLRGLGQHLGPESAIDRMLMSLAHCAGDRAVGVVLSGSGDDGAEGIFEIRRLGGTGVVQDIANCMQHAMPLAVLQKGPVEKILPDFHMAEYFMNLNHYPQRT
jgi:two-component system chemotaxis response regulator CheB